MAKSGVIALVTGEVVGRVFCSQDEDMDRQEFADRIIEVPPDHPALYQPERYRVRLHGARKVVEAKPKDKEARAR